MSPILARQEKLPPATMDALRQGVAVADRGRLSGTGVSGFAPRGAAVEQSRSIPEPSRESVGPRSGIAPPNGRRDSWRSEQPVLERPSRSDDWRGRSAPALSQRPASATRSSAETERPAQDWRSRSEVPPARRVIEGAVPGRRSLEAGDGSSSTRDARPARNWDESRGARRQDVAPPQPAPRSEPRVERSRPAPPARPPSSSHHDRKSR